MPALATTITPGAKPGVYFFQGHIFGVVAEGVTELLNRHE